MIRLLDVGPRHRMILGADDEVGRWVNSRIPNPSPWIDGTGTSIGFTREQSLVAGFTFYLYSGSNVWIGIASDEPGWCTRRALALVADYPFRQLKVKRISALVDASNHRSRQFVERLGFTCEATLADAAPDGDQLIYRLFAHECKWLKGEVSG